MEKQSKLTRFIEGDWSKVFIIAITVFGLFAWNRSESRADYRELRAFSESYLSAINQEMKDFHGRLERQDAEFKAHMTYYHLEKK